MKQLSYAVIFAVIGGVVYMGLNQENKMVRKFEFTYQVDLVDDPNSEETMKAWIPVPQSINNVQTVSNHRIDYNKNELECNELTEDVHKNKYYFCEAKNDKIKKTSVVLIWDVERMEIGEINHKGLDPNIYKKPNKMVPVSNTLFSTVIKEENLESSDIKQIYKHVLEGMHYGKHKNEINDPNHKYINGGKNKNTDKEWLPKDITYGRKKKRQDQLVESQNKSKKYAYGNGNATYACDIGVGNCTDYHSYFMSLCRTLDVPARFHMGFNIPPDDTEDGEGIVKGYHCWADYYKEGQGWIPVDISEADKAPDKVEYFFGTLDKNRVEFTTGRDLKLKGRDGVENFFIYPILEGAKTKVKDKKTYSFKYKNI